jgi:hypothetical protein
MRIVFSCVSDNSPKFAVRTRGFVATLIQFCAVLPSDIIVHLVEQPDEKFIAELKNAGVGVRIVPRISTLRPALNKLAQLSTPELRQAEVVVLCDCDLAFLSDIRPRASSDRICGRLVAHPNPPFELWRGILAEACLPLPPMERCAVSNADTLAQNFNGGMLMIPRQIFLRLVEDWPRWASWVEQRIELLGGSKNFSDQVSFALACIEQNYPIEYVSAAYNYPAAEKENHPIGGVVPRVLHYHDNVDEVGRIKHVGCSQIDSCIDRANVVLGEAALQPRN